MYIKIDFALHPLCISLQVMEPQQRVALVNS